MDQIEVKIKLETNNKIYYLPIRKSNTILKLKEYCKIISNIPQDKQNLLYKGKILLDEKLISDYNIENNHDIILVKKEELKSKNTLLIQNYNNSNNNFQNNNDINFLNNKKIIANRIADAYKQLPDLLSYYKSIDANKVDDLCKSLGFKGVEDLCGVNLEEYKKILKGNSIKDLMDMSKEPSIIEMALNNPANQEKIKKFPFLKFALQNPSLIYSPSNLQMVKNMLNENERKSIENSGIGISIPPDPFKNSSGLMSNNTGNKEILINSGINLDYKEKYKEQLSQLKNMGFTNEEINIQALKLCNGNIENAFDKILEMNN